MRIERVAERERIRLYLELDLEDISKRLTTAEVRNSISDISTHYFCNEAYWFSLQKYKGKAMFIHVPTTKNADGCFLEKMKEKRKIGRGLLFRAVMWSWENRLRMQ